MASTRVREHVVKCFDSTWTYLCAGKGPSVVWLHGLWGEPGWELHHQRLAEHYTVYAPALPGYHGSSFPQWMIDSEDAATLVIDFLETIKLERPFVIGHSLGRGVNCCRSGSLPTKPFCRLGTHCSAGHCARLDAGAEYFLLRSNGAARILFCRSLSRSGTPLRSAAKRMGRAISS